MRFAVYVDKLSKYAGFVAAVAAVATALLVAYDATMRYLFSAGSVALQELEWHLYDVVFLFGLSYALMHDKHVRVDIFYERFAHDTKAMIAILTQLLMVIPFGGLLIVYGYDMALQSYVQGEISSDPGGLGARWMIKSVLVLGAVLLVIQSFAEIVKAFVRLKDKTKLHIALALTAIAGAAIFAGWWYRLAYPIDPVYLLFFAAFFGLMAGFPVAFVFGSSAMLFAAIDDSLGMHVLEMLPYRIYGSVMSNVTLMAVPLFIFMGLVLERSKMAEGLLESMGKLFGPVRGGVAISVVLVGAILAASTGIVGASVVMMSLIALPLMLKHGYAPTLASGSIAASGTLGQLIPPSIVLIVLGDQMHLSVGDLFKAAVVPGILLVLLYIFYIFIIAFMRKDIAPAIVSDEAYGETLKAAFKAVIPPLLLIGAVLGSIFTGIASPTESAAVGVVGSLVLAAYMKTFHFGLLRYAAVETVKLSAMIFMILIGATAFSLVFNELGGGEMALRFFTGELGSATHFILIAMLVIFLLGFFIDFIEIAFVVVPILVPIVASFGIDPLWFAILIAMNLQASFLTPPFGFALFYLKGAAGDKVRTSDIYKGVIPFIVLQLVALGIVYAFPEIIRVFN
jgi:tripartite ATP-independent transporter DctM subunit